MPELEDFETLAEDVRSTAPQPRDVYVARLEQRVEQGFPKEKRRRERGWLFTPALALAACTVLALVLVVGVIGVDNGSDDEGASGGSSGAMPIQDGGQESGSPASPPEDVAGFREAAPLRPSTRSFRSGRQVERRTSLDLAPGDDAFEDVTAGVLRIADASSTVVQRSSVTERNGRGLATYDLRVPTSRLDDVLAQLSELAKVTERTASSQDITAPYVSATDRLEDARAERDALLRALARAETDVQAEALRIRVRNARVRISRAERDVRRLQRRADRARVDVTVASTGRDGGAGGGWTPREALGDAGSVLETSLGVALVAGAVLLPFGVLLALAWAAARLTRRRRREAALG